MAKATTSFVCQSCGASQSKWSGQCTACGQWNSLAEESAQTQHHAVRKGRGHLAIESLSAETKGPQRRATGIAEFDRVAGGGLVPGSANLIGGDPGIGKSTLLLQVAAKYAALGEPTLYVSGEEAADQVRLRAERLGLKDSAISLAASTSVRDILSAVDQPGGPSLVIIDSIQTMYLDVLESAPGTVSQVRGCAQELIRAAKKNGFALLLVGHVTKDGTIAGPKVLEHMVDAVFQFEGDRSHQFRLLRAVKNRFGPADEIGVFEMLSDGMREVANPSELFLAERDQPVAGAAVFAGQEGTRPVLVEIQALVAPSPLATPRRAVVGWDSGRLAMVLAVLEARCGFSLGMNDIYLNVAGGLRISEPAADLAVAAALISSHQNKPLPGDAVFFGELGLSGEIRSVAHQDQRLKEAEKLGFAAAWMPQDRRKKKTAPTDLELVTFRHLAELVNKLD